LAITIRFPGTSPYPEYQSNSVGYSIRKANISITL
jgi:hypothetical protein